MAEPTVEPDHYPRKAWKPGDDTRHWIATDATYDNTLKVAAIAACRIKAPTASMPSNVYGPLNARVVSCDGIHIGELAAIEMAMRTLKDARVREARFHCDAQGVVRVVTEGWNTRDGTPPNHVGQHYSDLVHSVRRTLTEMPGYSLELVHRSKVSPAHTLAKLTLKAWKQGREENPMIVREPEPPTIKPSLDSSSRFCPSRDPTHGLRCQLANHHLGAHRAGRPGLEDWLWTDSLADTEADTYSWEKPAWRCRRGWHSIRDGNCDRCGYRHHGKHAQPWASWVASRKGLFP